MGGIQGKEKCITSNYEIAVENLKRKVKNLQEEMNEIMYIRDAENQAYEQEMMVFALKEVVWKKEKKKLKEEVKKLKKKLQENTIQEEEEICVLEEKKCQNEEFLTLNMLELREEKARRDEAVEKWKQLYFAIKIELDDLIQRTYQAGICWKGEEERMVEELQKEMIAKEENIQLLKEEVAAMKKREYKRERELDILRQSLRIMCFNRKQKQQQQQQGFRVKNTPEACIWSLNIKK